MPKPLFTVETARLAGLRSAQLRAERKLLPPPQPLELVHNGDLNGQLAYRACVLDQKLERLKAKLDKAEDPKEILQICQAIDRLESHWARYAGVAMPARGKPGRRQTSSPPEPL